MQIITEQTTRVAFDAGDGETLELAHTEGAATVTLAYQGFHGAAQLVLPAAKLRDALELIETALDAFGMPEPPSDVVPGS